VYIVYSIYDETLGVEQVQQASVCMFRMQRCSLTFLIIDKFYQAFLPYFSPTREEGLRDISPTAQGGKLTSAAVLQG
jgi:hypothetical protein